MEGGRYSDSDGKKCNICQYRGDSIRNCHHTNADKKNWTKTNKESKKLPDYLSHSDNCKCWNCTVGR